MKNKIIGLWGLILMAPSPQVCAGSWLDTGDVLLRHQLQLLADSSELKAPLTTWPLSAADITASLKNSQREIGLSSSLLSVVSHHLTNQDSNFSIGAEFVTDYLLIRDFSGDGQKKSKFFYDGAYQGDFVNARLKAALVEKSGHPDDDNLALDESYLSTSFRNWKLTAGKQSRWWGPGWDGSLILSNNARPIPSVSLDRDISKPFENKYLKWVGPWKLSIFAGQLESSRHIPDVKLLGARLNFKPTHKLEIGLSRTAQWGGEGRPQTLSSLLNSIAGIDNYYADRPGGKSEEPGNQLAGVDFRWRSPLGNAPYAIYGQFIGEDEANKLPSKNIGLLGAELWGGRDSFKSSWRLYLEAADTSTNFYKGRVRNNTAYNHGIYHDGYRYHGESLGHSIDTDARLISIGGIVAQSNGNYWRAWGKYARLNTDGVGYSGVASEGLTWKGLGLSYEKKIGYKTKVNTGVQLVHAERDEGSNSDLEFMLGLVHSF